MTDVNAAFAAAVARHQAGDVAAAEQMYRAILAEVPAHAPTLCNLGVLLVRANQPDDAARCYNLALAAAPGYPDAHYNLGNLFRRSNQLAQAASHYQSCLAGNPNHAGAAYNLGLVLSNAGHLPEAIECFRSVIRLEPGNADAFGRLGDALIRSGHLAEGVTAFRKAVELKPSDPRAIYNLGLGLSNQGKTTEAHELLQKALKLKPDYAEAHNALGLNLETLGRKDDALFHYQQAVQYRPDLADGWSNLGTNLGEQGRADEAIVCLRESLVHRPNSPPIHSNLLLMLNYSSQYTPEQVRDEHKIWAERFAGPTRDPAPVPEPHDPDRILKIGYLSADFRTHTVAPFIEALLRHHDRDNYEIYAYASVQRPDETTSRLRALADHWRPIAGLPDERVFDQIRSDGIDVMVDLSGHTAGNRILTLAPRPAPVQATLFGYPNTTGIEGVDYRISDPVSDPPGMTESLYVERLLRLPECAWVYVPPLTAPEITPLPAQGRRTFTFGCLNNPAKISDQCLETWAKILQTIPGTRIVLLAGQSQAGAKRLGDRFTQFGIFRDRVELTFRLPKQQYFETFQLFDLALDPFPYNGGVSTGDALWMGVPVLTMAGQSYVSRQGAMVMQSIGLPQFVPDSPAQLIDIAREWVGRRAELAEIRKGLRERMMASPITDAVRYVRNLETALRNAWRERLAS